MKTPTCLSLFITSMYSKLTYQKPLLKNEFGVTSCNNTLILTRKVKAASGRLSFKPGYNQRCQWSYFLHTAMPKLHAKFHQNRCTSFGEK